MEVKNIKTTEVAKIVRKELKKNFPKTKFSVRSKSYSGGSSITAFWENGASEKEVYSLIRKFSGAGFDGMTDSKYYHKPEIYDGELVSWGVDYVSASRKLTDDVYIKKANEITKQFGLDKEFSNINELRLSPMRIGSYYLYDYTYQELYKLNLN